MTHEELLKLNGKRVTCKILGNKIKDAKIRVERDSVFICQDLLQGASPKDTLGYTYGRLISSNRYRYGAINESCTNIELLDVSPKGLLFSGAMCKTQDGNVVMYIELKNMSIVDSGMFLGKSGWLDSHYNNDLDCKDGDKFSIIEIRNPLCIRDVELDRWNLKGQLVWKREEVNQEKIELQKSVDKLLKEINVLNDKIEKLGE